MSGIFNGLAFDCLPPEGKRDWLDGWHEECGMGFKSQRSPTAERLHFEMDPQPGTCADCRRLGVVCQHRAVTAAECMEAGRLERRAIREARGV